ncbi:MAG: alpha/beta fold hydrolase [Bacillota bacterium]
MKYWKEYYKDCETKIIKDAAHVTNLDAVDEFNEIMLGFLTKCENMKASYKETEEQAL